MFNRSRGASWFLGVRGGGEMTIFSWPGIWREAGGRRGCRPNAAPDAWLAARAENKGVVVFLGGVGGACHVLGYPQHPKNRGKIKSRLCSA